jgi:hypothetical protein
MTVTHVDRISNETSSSEGTAPIAAGTNDTTGSAAAASGQSAAAPVYDPRRWKALPVVLTATFMSLFDIFVVNVAAPSIQHDLHASSSVLELVVAGYSFSYAAGLVTGARLGDRSAWPSSPSRRSLPGCPPTAPFSSRPGWPRGSVQPP